MAADQLFGNAHRTAHAAHLVLEQQAQRLDDLQVHLLGKPADVVVRLDRGRRAVDRTRLDHIRIDRTLRQPLDVLDLNGLLVENLHEVAADDLALPLGVRNARQIAQELGRGIHALDPCAYRTPAPPRTRSCAAGPSRRRRSRGSCRWPCAAARPPPTNPRRPKAPARPCRRPASRAVRAR
jgi:hypothetical protein